MVEEGRLSQAWQSPTQRNLAPNDSQEVINRRLAAPSAEEGGLRGAAHGTRKRHGHAREPPLDNFHIIGERAAVGTRDRPEAQNRSNFYSEVSAHAPIEGGKEGVGRALESERRLRSQGSANDETCPLIYTVDARTAKKHGLFLFQVI